MKPLLFALLFPLTVAAQQTPFVLKGQIGHLGPDCQLLLTYLSNGKEISDSVHLQDGKFEFKGTISDVSDALLILTTPQNMAALPLDAILFYIEKGTMELTGKDSLITATFTAGAVNQEYQALQARLKPIREKQKSIYRDYTSAPLEARHLPAFQSSIADEYTITRKDEKQVYLSFAATHPNSIISIVALQWYANGVPDTKADSLYQLLSPAIKSSTQGKAFRKLLK
ncbi:DUF4369 domain-containing protein [Chitinophaga sp. LS1]|uniref:DUF4369 domain-containing protein n=1 Tax=Chitinophaga sp. LS1 TaxID=3051176 RepID=UPI002AABD18D|nr:DUF4369 domain-containing protein [Chitinophaga sp. LS1]WPV67620.1 DUF4369 domain-containing protein [Chitinophaga sp. LS1]